EQRAGPWTAWEVHARQRHPAAVRRCAWLPFGGGAIVRVDGDDPRRDPLLRPHHRDGEADRMTTVAEALPRRRSLSLGWMRNYVLTVYAGLALVYLFLPIAVVVLFSFNNPAGRFNFTWQGFTFRNWTNPFGYPGLRESVVLSIQIALLSSFVATVLGTMIALALVRYGFRGRGLVNLLIFVPMATPEIVM